MLIQTYLQSLATQLQFDDATEHTHRPTLQNLLTALLPHYRITNEPRRIACGSPDFEIAKDGVPIGHIEAKDVGVDLDKVLKSEQLQRYLPALNNLLLTDYLTFRWFVNGEYLPEMTVILASWDDKRKKLLINSEQVSRFEVLIRTFVETQIITLRSPGELAAKMAHIAQLINDVILKAYHQENGHGKITEQLDSFRSVLMDTLKIEQFADMVAQTVCYGLFAAKCSADLNLPFSRIHASYYLPKTNPFLRNLFNQMAGIDLDERLVWMVEHLVAVLNRADIAAILADFGKQTRQEDPVVHFYETFLAQYDPKLREVRGVYYTPEPVVSYIVRSVDLILREQFALKQGLADSSKINETTHKVQILDPAVGTGTFLYSVFAKIFEQFGKNKGMWSDYVSKHLLPRVHGFELLMAAYTVAHMKLGLQLKEYGYDFQSEERLRIFLTNTLDAPHYSDASLLAKWLSDEANAANQVKRESPVMVILGNPPYSGHSANTGEWISNLLHGIGNQANYFMVDGQSLNERNPKWLNDDYVKFIRFAHWRVQQTGYGILGFVTNHGYLDNPTFRGMRQSLIQDFDEIYILDLHGNAKKNEQSPDGSVDKNVFDIQQGVAIGIFVKHRDKKMDIAKIYHAHLYGERKAKYQWLSENNLKTTQWTELEPQKPFYLFIPQNMDLLPEYEQFWKITDIMPINSVGIVTGQDKETIAFDYKTAKKLAQTHSLAETVIKPILYRPFDKNYIVYDELVVTRPRREVMQHMLQGENLGLITVRKMPRNSQCNYFMVTDRLISNGVIRSDNQSIDSLFPLYIYPAKKDEFINGNSGGRKSEISRKPNFSPEFIKKLETCLKLQFVSEGKGNFEKTIGTLDVFYYIYAVFHSPTYRQRYAEFLKMDFPRLPLTSDNVLFKQLAELGEQLVKIHLMEAEIENDCGFPIKGDNLVKKLVYQDEKVYINKIQYFDQVKSEVWEFHIGGYQVCQKWLKDRKGRILDFDDCSQYLYILSAIEKTRELMEKVDDIIGKFSIF